MSNFIIKIENTSGEIGTIIPDIGFSYTDNLNEVNQANIKISGSSSSKRSLIEMGSIVKIYRNTTLEFKGLIDKVDYLSAGGMSIQASGWEIWLGKENGDYANSPWTDTASATIFNAIIAESNYLSAGTVETGTDTDFRSSYSDSLWNSISNLKSKTTQDIGIDYVNDEVDILDHKGSTTSVATFNAEIQINEIRVTQAYPIANDVRVYGKGDGTNQIKSNFVTAGQDATSKAAYGTIRKIVRDPSVLSITEANLLANALVAVYKNPVKIYDFNIMNTSQNIVSGDVITLNAKSQGLSNEEVRIVGIVKGVIGDSEYLTYSVTNKEYSQKISSRDEVIAAIEKNARDQQTYMQGTTNILTFSEQINANSTASLKILANFMSSEIFDEVGNNRVNSFTLDYDVDPYRKGIGDASEDSVAPGVAGSSANTQPGVSGSSANTQPGVSGSSANTQPGVSGSSGSAPALITVTSTSVGGTSCSSGTWTTVATRSVAQTGSDIQNFANIYIQESSGGPENIYIRIINTTLGSSPQFLTYIENFGSGATESGDFATNGMMCEFLQAGGVYNLQVFPITGAITINAVLEIDQDLHSHADGTYAADNHLHADGTFSADSHLHADGTFSADSHLHADGTYAADSHNHNVSIGDSVSDAASLNASEVSIYLDFWNGSSWTNKHSILNTEKTLETEVDISDSGTYPDAAGLWRVRIITDSASSDLIKGVIKCKHELDT